MSVGIYTGAKPGEVFVGNTLRTEVPEYLQSLKTVRLGKPALDIHGKILDHAQAVFISKTELGVYDRIMMTRTFPGQRYYPPAY